MKGWDDKLQWKPTDDDEVHWKHTDDEKSSDDNDNAEDHTKVCLNEITDDTSKRC